jgi:hypothetical protein
MGRMSESGTRCSGCKNRPACDIEDELNEIKEAFPSEKDAIGIFVSTVCVKCPCADFAIIGRGQSIATNRTTGRPNVCQLGNGRSSKCCYEPK